MQEYIRHVYYTHRDKREHCFTVFGIVEKTFWKKVRVTCELIFKRLSSKPFFFFFFKNQKTLVINVFVNKPRTLMLNVILVHCFGEINYIPHITHWIRQIMSILLLFH